MVPVTETVGRYAIHDEIASGGMASIHLGRVLAPGGDVVAIKRMHPHFAKDPDFRTMFIDEARVAARIRHPNVVPTLEIVERDGELLLVMEFVNGESLATLLRTLRERGGHRVPPSIAASIVSSVLHGLHAAHEATNEGGEPLGIVHRDVSPANVLVGADGVTRVLDFGVAKARGRLQTTREGQLKGKLSYMAPEQVDGRGVDRRTDVFSAGAVLWEVLAGRRLFDGMHEAAIIAQLIAPDPAPPSTLSPELEPFDEVVFGALQANPSLRYATALEMAEALEAAVTPATPAEVARWVDSVAADELRRRAHRAAELEGNSGEYANTPQDMAHTPDEAPFLAALDGLPPPQPAPPPPSWTPPPPPIAYPKSVPPSQVSSVSLTTTRIEPPPVPPAQVKRLVAVGVASAILVGIFTSLILPDRDPSPAAPDPSSSAESAPSAVPTAPPPPPSATTPPAQEPSEAAPPTAAPTASAAVAPVMPVKPPVRSQQLTPIRQPPAEWGPQKPKPVPSAPAVRSPFGK